MTSLSKIFRSAGLLVNNKKFNTAILHAFVWIVLLLLPAVLIQSDSPYYVRMLNHVWISIVASLIVFYANYSFLIGKLAFQRHVIAFIAINLVMFSILPFISDFLHQLVSPPSPKQRPPMTLKNFSFYGMSFYREFIMYSLVTGIAIALRTGGRLSASESERKRLETENLKSQISLLKYQIQPHFFFNTLNNIYALIGKSPAEAQQAVIRLSKLMRYVLYDNNVDSISLEKEIEFLNNYNKLMQLRLTPNNQVEFNYPQNTMNISVPPLIFVSLLENAYKHGVCNSEPSFIKNSITFTDQEVVFAIENSTHNFDKNEDKSRSGIGLINMQKRLDIIYGSNYSLDIVEENKIFRVVLKIPVRNNQ